MNVWKKRGHAGRRLAGVALAVLILALALSVLASGACATKGPLYLTACCTLGHGVCRPVTAPVAVETEAAGEESFVEAGFTADSSSLPLPCVDWYCGEHCRGACRLTP
jgi:hypothetical protein